MVVPPRQVRTREMRSLQKMAKMACRSQKSPLISLIEEEKGTHCNPSQICGYTLPMIALVSSFVPSVSSADKSGLWAERDLEAGGESRNRINAYWVLSGWTEAEVGHCSGKGLAGTLEKHACVAEFTANGIIPAKTLKMSRPFDRVA